MGLATPLSAWLADRFGRRPVLLTTSAIAAAVGFALPALLGGGEGSTLVFLCIALGAMGLTFAPLGAQLPELFPTNVGYTGASVAYNLGGILGASLAPYLAQRLLERGGLTWVGYYIVAAAAVSFLSLLSMRRPGRPAPCDRRPRRPTTPTVGGDGIEETTRRLFPSPSPELQTIIANF